MPPEGQVALLKVQETSEADLFIGDASWVTFTLPEESFRTGRFEDALASVFVG
jgi:hypothetical protein